jgi:DNA-binding CsgD family transcriptional regulator
MGRVGSVGSESELMPRPRKLSRLQADPINGHDGRGDGQTDGDDPGAPRIRLQDWEVIDEVSVGSTDYVILRRTKGQKSGIESLTPRERDAVRLACTGASNKHIAWAMGISDSTVGVLLLRARRKLKVVGRDELIRAFET